MGLESAYELGRAAMREGLSILNIADVHQQMVETAFERASTLQEQRHVARHAKEFFMESLSTFEMTQRGFAEAHQTARLERQHSAQLRALADAALAINSARSLQELTGTVTEWARGIIGANRCSTSLTGSELTAKSALPVPEGEDGAHATSDGLRLAEVVRSTNTPLRMGRDELKELARKSPGIREATDGGFLGAPLIARDGRNLGLVELYGKRGEEFTQNDQAILEQLAQMASVAVENLRLYEHEHRIAESLQRSLLPENLPPIPGIALAARFEPGGIGVHVGGDWYDVIRLPNGRVGLAIGDVAGRGVRAAAIMGQLKMALRSYAVEAHPPATVVDRLNRLIHSFDNPEMATLVYLVVDPETASVRFVNAGHPPPLLRLDDGSVSYLDGGHSVPIGAMEGAEFREVQTELSPGMTLMLYTDGLVERRGATIDQGFERLADAATEAPLELQRLCDHITAAVFGKQGGTDDMAILALRRLSGHQDRFYMDVETSGASLAAVRTRLTQWLRSVGASRAQAADVVLACHEACANAVKHASRADSSFVVEAALTGEQLVLTVRDQGVWQPPPPQQRGRGLALIEALMTEVEISADAQGTQLRMQRPLELSNSHDQS